MNKVGRHMGEETSLPSHGRTMTREKRFEKLGVAKDGTVFSKKKKKQKNPKPRQRGKVGFKEGRNQRHTANKWGKASLSKDSRLNITQRKNFRPETQKRAQVQKFPCNRRQKKGGGSRGSQQGWVQV